jgi:hypothetical protein
MPPTPGQRDGRLAANFSECRKAEVRRMHIYHLSFMAREPEVKFGIRF